MFNYGRVTPKVVLLDRLPNINEEPLIPFFEVNAYAVRTLANTFRPQTCLDFVADDRETFASVYPSKRPFMIHNFLNVSGSTTGTTGSPSILWTPVGNDMPLKDTLSGVSGGLLYNTTANPSAYPSYTLEQPNSYVSYSSGYKGPQWTQTSVPYIPPNGNSDNQNISKAMSGAGLTWTSAASFTWDTSGSNFAGGVKAIYQTVSKSGVWWGIESTPFLQKNMSFNVNFIIHHPPNASNGASPFLMVSLGPNSNTSADRIDCVIPFNKKPYIMDYGNQSYNEWTDNSATISDSVKNIEVSFMTIAGKLISSINGKDYVYSRISNSGISEITIKGGPIRIYGAGIAATIHAAPLAFSPAGIFFHQYSSGYTYKNCTASGDLGTEDVCVFPKTTGDASSDPGATNKVYGVDCSAFTGVDGVVTNIGTSGFGFHGLGKCWQLAVPTANISNAAAVFLAPTPINMSGASSSYYFLGGCPYFFKIKGVASSTITSGFVTETDITDLVMNVDEEVSAPDYFYVKKSASVVCYGNLSNKISGTSGQVGIRISWTNNMTSNNNTHTFTGLVNAYNISNTPGKTITTLQCEDYMYILSNTYMLNSPIYDGMIMAYAVQDIARRCGMINSVIDWTSTEMFFNKAGYAFSSPALKFPDKSVMLDNILQMVKGDSAYIYFDGDGVFHIARIPGGLMGSTTAVISKTFSSNPSAGYLTILNEDAVTIDYSSTVNKISLLTLDRLNRDYIVESTESTGTANKIRFKKVFLYDEAAIGGVLEARSRVRELGEMMFRSIQKKSFTTTLTSGNIVQPLDFVNVNDGKYRIMGIKRTYNAENNEALQVIESSTLGTSGSGI